MASDPRGSVRVLTWNLQGSTRRRHGRRRRRDQAGGRRHRDVAGDPAPADLAAGVGGRHARTSLGLQALGDRHRRRGGRRAHPAPAGRRRGRSCCGGRRSGAGAAGWRSRPRSSGTDQPFAGASTSTSRRTTRASGGATRPALVIARSARPAVRAGHRRRPQRRAGRTGLRGVHRRRLDRRVAGGPRRRRAGRRHQLDRWSPARPAADAAPRLRARPARLARRELHRRRRWRPARRRLRPLRPPSGGGHTAAAGAGSGQRRERPSGRRRDRHPDLLRKVRKLLAKAEATDNPREAEAFSAKAAALIAAHRIDVARLADDRDPDELRVRRVPVGRGAYVRARLALLQAIAGAHDAELVWQAGPDGATALLAGFASDLDSCRRALRVVAPPGGGPDGRGPPGDPGRHPAVAAGVPLRLRVAHRGDARCRPRAGRGRAW